MAQALPRYCPRCGTPTRADMQRCPTCELPVGAMLSRPDMRQKNSGDYANTRLEGAVVPNQGYMQQGNEAFFSSPPAQNFQSAQPPQGGPSFSPLPSGPGDWNTPNQPAQQPWSSPAPASWDAGGAYPANNPANRPSWDNPSLPPFSSSAPQTRRRPRAGRIFLVLLILLLLAGGGVFAFLVTQGKLLNHSQASIKTTSLNSTVTYAGANITLVNVQQSQNFVDDPQSTDTGMLRLTLQEQNTTSVPITWDYTQSARLLVQGKSALAPTYVTARGSLAPGASRKSTLDFAVANGGNLQTLVFQLGTDKEAQMQIPLTGQANLSQYQTKTTPQKGTLSYFGLDWKLTNATTSLSLPDQQASKGMEFLTLDVSIDNTLSQQAISGSAFDYMRVKAGGQTIAPLSTTIPVSFATGDMGKKGSATFLIPQNNTSCTLILLSQDPGTGGEAKLDFHIG